MIHRTGLTPLFFAISLLGATYASAVCNQPPIPAPGQTVTWLAANSPFQICADLTIPKGGTVIVQPAYRFSFRDSP
jgi:hypothetical protein